MGNQDSGVLRAALHPSTFKEIKRATGLGDEALDELLSEHERMGNVSWVGSRNGEALWQTTPCMREKIAPMPYMREKSATQSTYTSYSWVTPLLLTLFLSVLLVIILPGLIWGHLIAFVVTLWRG
ncbi:hypothetical protein ACWERW_11335 [Streptomyces sp. NPDC004012]